SRVEVVTLDVVVVDKQGRAVRGLAAADFTVFEDGRPSERAFVFLVDDLGLDFGPVSGAKKAIAQWLTTKALPADDVTILTTSGDLSWNDRVVTGREDLLGILGRVQGGRPRAQQVRIPHANERAAPTARALDQGAASPSRSLVTFARRGSRQNVPDDLLVHAEVDVDDCVARCVDTVPRDVSVGLL